MEDLTRDLEIELRAKIDVLDLMIERIKLVEPGSGSHGLDILLAIVQGTQEGYENVLARMQDVSE